MACYGHQIASALKMLKARKIVHSNISADYWLLTRRNKLRLLDFSWAGKGRVTRLEILEARTIHGCVALEVLMGAII
jgi:serine/threonine protein kinase